MVPSYERLTMEIVIKIDKSYDDRSGILESLTELWNTKGLRFTRAFVGDLDQSHIVEWYKRSSDEV